eukprot:TRINITY_DN12305_c0_g3_i1.p2 TRINITY_DN12305_c0_g3~~TRINITY_DN12305_c0_g3_i1.p2  ORF type:complete len:191 (+),score=28.66 TRINITY_DN12305_c0_g3_i1:84-575(+)
MAGLAAGDCDDMEGRSIDAPDPVEVGLVWQRARAMRDTPDGQEGPMDSSGQEEDGTADPPTDSSSASSSSADVLRNTNRQRDLHEQGKCMPCGYFSRKSDGCWKGASCEFCHYCNNKSYQTWKRRERRQRKREAAATPQEAGLEDHLAEAETDDDEGGAMRWQ